MLLSTKWSRIVVAGWDHRLTIAAACRRSLDDDLAMPASSYSLRLTAIVPRGRRSIARLMLVVLTVCSAGWSIAQTPAPQPRAEQEPITPIPPPPVQDPRQVALGDRLFHDTRLSNDNTRSCNSCHDTSTNGASASLNPTPGAAALNIPTVFNAALSFRLNWEGDLRTLESHVEQTLRNPGRMGSSLNEALNKLRADPELSRQFRDAYGARWTARHSLAPSRPTRGLSSRPGADSIGGLKATSTRSPPRNSPGTSCSSRSAASLAIKG